MRPKDRLEVLFGELSELAGQRNAIDGRVVAIVAEMDRDGLCGMTGARSVQALVAWKLGTSLANAHAIAAVAHRAEEFPHCVRDLREGRLSLDQVGVIAEKAAPGSDEHYAHFAASATVAQLAKAIKWEAPPKPEPDVNPEADPEPEAAEAEADADSEPEPEPDTADAEPEFVPTPPPPAEAPRSFTRVEGEQSTTYKIVLPHAEAAIVDAALQSHHDALVAQWKRDHGDDGDGDRGDGGDGGDSDGGDGDGGGSDVQTPPFPNRTDGFMALVKAGWDTDVAHRPHGQHTTVVVHLDVEHRNAALHLGPFLTDADRRELMCDADCEIWFEKHGQVIGSARATRHINRRLRRALEHRDRCCRVPGCGASRGLHAHHIVHWEDGGLTELVNLVLLCPYHHRLHHRGGITISGTGYELTVLDGNGHPMTNRSLARPPTKPPPNVKPYPGPTGERADWWWYTPFQRQPPPRN